jgi:CBS domain-containing protein
LRRESTASDAPRPTYENWPARRTGSVERLFPNAASHLVVIDQQTSISDAAGKFVGDVEMLVVSGTGEAMAGVLTKTDVLSHLTLPQMRQSAHLVPVSIVMTRNVVRCSRTDRLGAVWDMMHALDLRNIPITCAALKPLGILNARHALIAMLEDAEDEDRMLRDYVMGVGYR